METVVGLAFLPQLFCALEYALGVFEVIPEPVRACLGFERFELCAGIGQLERLPEVEALKRMNCDIGQGTVFTGPMSPNEFIAVMYERAATRRNGRADGTAAG